MGLIWFGVKKANIGIDEFTVRCPACEADNYADIMIASNYFHIYFVPIFPFEKEANIICQKCGLKRYEVPFNSKTFKNYYEIKSKFKHPWYTYFFVALFSIIILITILVSFLPTSS